MRCTPSVFRFLPVGLLGVLLAATVFAQGATPVRRRPSPAMAPIVDDPQLPRVLLIGDSISIGYTLPVRELLKGDANVHRPAANCGPTIRGVEQIDAWLGDGRWDVIHFNWGLHDLKRIDGKHQVSLDEYEKHIEALVQRMRKTGAKLIWCSTTPVPEGVTPPRTDADVNAYNAVAAKIMQEYDIPTDDLYTFALARLDKIQQPKNVHFSPAGSAVLAQEVARQIRRRLADE